VLTVSATNLVIYLHMGRYENIQDSRITGPNALKIKATKKAVRFTARPLPGHCSATARPLSGHCSATARPLCHRGMLLHLTSPDKREKRKLCLCQTSKHGCSISYST